MHRLQSMGVNVWYDAGIAPGATWREEIAQALANASRMLFYVTRNSVNSMHCQQETARFITQELGGNYLFGLKGNQSGVLERAQLKLPQKFFSP